MIITTGKIIIGKMSVARTRFCAGLASRLRSAAAASRASPATTLASFPASGSIHQVGGDESSPRGVAGQRPSPRSHKQLAGQPGHCHRQGVVTMPSQWLVDRKSLSVGAPTLSNLLLHPLFYLRLWTAGREKERRLSNSLGCAEADDGCSSSPGGLAFPLNVSRPRALARRRPRRTHSADHIYL